MNSVCILLLALALFGAFANAFVSSYGGGLGYELGYGGGYGGGYGAGFRGTGVCAPTVCDHCHCVKTIVRPSHVERIPYTCTRRVQTGGCAPTCGAYPRTSVELLTGTSGANGFINGGFGGSVGALGCL